MTSTAPDLSTELAVMKAAERFKHLHGVFGPRVVATTSFGLQAAVSLHLIHYHAPEIPVVFIDTGYLFPETYQYIDELMENGRSIFAPTHPSSPPLAKKPSTANSGNRAKKAMTSMR